MGQCLIMTGGNAGDGSDDCTATKSQVLEGYKAITNDSDDEAVLGTMPNRGVGSHAVNSGINDRGLWYYIPPGYYPGSATDQGNCWVYRSPSEVASTIGLNSSILKAGSSVLGINGDGWTVWTGDVTAEDSHVLSGKTYWKQGAKRTGTMASMAGQTITPSANQQTIACSGKYMTGNIIVQPGVQEYSYQYNITVRKLSCYLSGQSSFNVTFPFSFNYSTQSLAVCARICERGRDVASSTMYGLIDNAVSGGASSIVVRGSGAIQGMENDYCHFTAAGSKLTCKQLRLDYMINRSNLTVPNEEYCIKFKFNVFAKKLVLR